MNFYDDLVMQTQMNYSRHYHIYASGSTPYQLTDKKPLPYSEQMVGFATGKQSHTGKRVRENGKVIVTVPGESLAGAVMACGASTGAETDKVAANNIEMMAVEGSDIQIPADTRLAMVAILQQSVEVGDHILHICQVDKFLGDEDKKGLYAWNGFGKVAPAAEG